jgi:hypothetical protein
MSDVQVVLCFIITIYDASIYQITNHSIFISSLPPFTFIYFSLGLLQNEYNKWDVSKLTLLQIVEHYNLMDYFTTLNLDESSMAASEGQLHIIGYTGGGKSTKRMWPSAMLLPSCVLVCEPMLTGLGFISPKGRRLSLRLSRTSQTTITIQPLLYLMSSWRQMPT